MSKLIDQAKQKLGITGSSTIPAPQVESGKRYKFTFVFEYLVSGTVKRTADIVIEEDTQEAAWRISVDKAKASCVENETVNFTGKVTSVDLRPEETQQ